MFSSLSTFQLGVAVDDADATLFTQQKEMFV